MESKANALDALASCIEYPTTELPSKIEKTVSVVKRRDRQAGWLLERFLTFLASTPVESAEEMHTQSFDLEPACCLYVGYHLFGDTHRRGVFMAHLAQWYQSYGFSAGEELPDHLAVLLRFLARAGEGVERSELIEYCLAPALEAIARGLNEKKSPYGDLIAAISLLVNRERGETR